MNHEKKFTLKRVNFAKIRSIFSTDYICRMIGQDLSQHSANQSKSFVTSSRIYFSSQPHGEIIHMMIFSGDLYMVSERTGWKKKPRPAVKGSSAIANEIASFSSIKKNSI
jgi:hypothetical protein